MVYYFKDIDTDVKLNKFIKKKAKKILLFTHITSDNIGDQIIEVCAEGLVDACLKNLGYKTNSYIIVSIDAGCVNNKYLSMQPDDMPQITEKIISAVDVVIFGGAPLFNYRYERFAERTAKTLKIISKYNKPVLFSAIGVEGYDESNEKCKKLKEAINSCDVKMITTRDNIDALREIVCNDKITTLKVSDPAVFSFAALSECTSKKCKKKVGIFVIRGMAFKDNRIDFGQDKAVNLWNDIAAELTERGYEYEFLTSGSHADEAFLDRLVTEFGIDTSRCVITQNTPEELIMHISSYQGVIACRLHPSIISYSLDVPSVGLVWNDKVSSFYENIGNPERAINRDGFDAVNIVDKLEKAIAEGVNKDEDYLMSVYYMLFDKMKIVFEKEDVKIFSFEELVKNIPKYLESDYAARISWKMSRIYRTFNSNIVTMRKRGIELEKMKKENLDLEKKIDSLSSLNNELLDKLNEISKIIGEDHKKN